MKKLIIIAASLMVSFWAKAQYSSVMSYDVGMPDGGTTIVRNMSNTEVITYVRNNTNHRFTYENSSTLAYKYIELSDPAFDKVEVHDFRIIDNVVYFCGVNNNLGQGVLGSFYASDILNPVGTPISINCFTVSSITTLNRLNAYIDPATERPRVAAVGHKNGSCGAWFCGVWVDCEGLLPSSTYANISVYDSFYGGTGDFELWMDVVSTNDWVVLVGYGLQGRQNGLVLRRFHKGNPTDSEIDKMYFYKELETIAWDEIRAVYIKNDDIAVAYRGIRNNNVTDFTKFRIFDINQMKNVNSQEYVIPNKSYLWEMAYMEHADRAVILNDFPNLDYRSCFAFLIPYQTTAYNSIYVNDKDWRFQSVTNLDGIFFVGVGPFHFILRDATAAYPAHNIYSTAPALCPEDYIIKVSVIDNISQNVDPENLIGPSFPIPIPLYSALINSRSLVVKCLAN